MCPRGDTNRNHGLTLLNLQVCVCVCIQYMYISRVEEGKSYGVDLGNRTCVFACVFSSSITAGFGARRDRDRNSLNVV